MVKKASTSLAQRLNKGGELAADLQEQSIADQAQQSGFAFFKADCSKARNRSAILRALAKAVDYPVFFGTDMDALLDCLSETVTEQKSGVVLWISQLHSGDPSLKTDVEAVLGVLKETTEFAQERKKVFAYYIEHVGKHSDPEPGKPPTPYAESAED